MLVLSQVGVADHEVTPEAHDAGLEDGVVTAWRACCRERCCQVRVLTAGGSASECPRVHGGVLVPGDALPGEGGLHGAVHGGEAADQRDDFELGSGVESGAVQEPEEVVEIAERLSTGGACG